jgi:hypothetical protein
MPAYALMSELIREGPWKLRGDPLGLLTVNHEIAD